MGRTFQIDTCMVPDFNTALTAVTGCQVSNVLLGVVGAYGGYKIEN